ncbi:MAG: MBL fold metallo-hydrolase [Fibrobacter sp.]|uniref:MBL fold metallo-hydrolase n=1 Tax=Fibrobacter sp. TaxID=35828 RepID=UPI0025BB9003|nr:MBL fold metallo-hydrolase [Fibrobacter sp.]MBR4784481.1 MBL fold metallo-hydrolase [Fibrobacter sp.]
MKKSLILFCSFALALMGAGCSDSQTSDKDGAGTNASVKVAKKAAGKELRDIAGTKTLVLGNGAIVTWIQDNVGEKYMPRSLFSDASDSLFNSLNKPEGLPASVGTFLVRVDGANILFDAGFGAFGGKMLSRLMSLGIAPENVQFVYLTHFHMDHIAGLISKDSTGRLAKTFPNAALYASKAEYDAWMNSIPQNEMQKNIMGLYKDSLHLFEFGDELPKGVTTIDAVGHTPGHTAFQISNLLVIGDLMHGYALQKDHPEINSNYDMDKPKAAESRKRILQYARDNKLLMAGMHLPPPGFAE